jgi:hypothetical protein
MTDDEIIAIMLENDELKAALREIACFDAARKHGYIDEWEEASAYIECKRIATEVLAQYDKDGDA